MIEACCCLKEVRKREKSKKKSKVKLEKGLQQPTVLKSEIVMGTKKVKLEAKQTEIVLSGASQREMGTAVVYNGSEVAPMTGKERAAIKLAAQALTPSVRESIEKIRQWQFVEAEKKRVTEQAVKQGDDVHEKLHHKSQKAVSTGSAILNNELNANLTDWVEYAIAWNTNKT